MLRIDQPLHENLPAFLAIVGPVFTLDFLSAFFDENNYHAFKSAQILGKPFGMASESALTFLTRSLTDGATDPIERQKWWTLEFNGRPAPWRTTNEPDVVAAQAAFWRREFPKDEDLDDAVAPPSRPSRQRQWAELAFWYPATSPPAGVAAIPLLNAVDTTGIEFLSLPTLGANIDFTSLGGEEGYDAATDSNLSHSFLYALAPPKIWKGFRVIKSIFNSGPRGGSASN